MRALFIRNVILSVLFLLAVLALETSHLSAPARAADATVSIDNFTFEPQRLTVKAGTTVRSRQMPRSSSRRHSTRTTNSRSRSRHRAFTITSAPCTLI
jgi:plastocyanin